MREDEARSTTREAFSRAYRRWKKRHAVPSDPTDELGEIGLLIFRMAADISQEQQRSHDALSFDELDALIRGDPTQSGVLDELGDGERNRLLWELKQGCLTAVLNCLPVGERMAFILSEVLEENPARVASILGISSSALRVRVSRARKKITAYLAPRCAHVDPRNPCRCPSRLGVALTRGFIGDVRGRQISLRARPFDQDAPQHDPVAIFRTLPAPEVPPELAAQLLDELDSGSWD